MTFESLESNGHPLRFPGLALAWNVLQAGEGATAVLNAANEIAVAAFLDRIIRFDQIHAVNLETLESVDFDRPGSLEELLALDTLARVNARRVVQSISAR